MEISPRGGNRELRDSGGGGVLKGRLGPGNKRDPYTKEARIKKICKKKKEDSIGKKSGGRPIFMEGTG